jgi:hypothetical protein
MFIFSLWIILVAGGLVGCQGLAPSGDSTERGGQEIDSFEACVQAGNPVMESYPRQCRTADGQLFVDEITATVEAGATVGEPEDPNQSGLAPYPGEPETGILEGKVAVGPLTPVVQEGVPEPTPAPEVYAERKIVIYAEDGQQEVTQVDIDPTGAYQVTLPAGIYVVDINHLGIDIAKGLPQQVEIKSQQITRLDVAIDTGIR